MTACRECHSDAHHNLSCSHVRYEGRVDVVPADEVAAPHEPPQPYCPGPLVACHFGETDEPQLCAKTGGFCYYAEGETL
jgi:hypothetical protein